ncbi:MAG: hypothetical protein Unbinned3992contig1000_22 [Prokaryotic dsDNA virus sp.]|nr:MAG: hypothetical protein Unbinned3992contig1000_22 [Prokaryotic dsDNA virus sp.]|tara:strand:+ start:7008 stop:7148 length:141 start_codon:yes stop_codon:yes gene_type:complete
MHFERMKMPAGIHIAVPIENDGRVDGRLLLIMRDSAWYLFRHWLSK